MESQWSFMEFLNSNQSSRPRNGALFYSCRDDIPLQEGMYRRTLYNVTLRYSVTSRLASNVETFYICQHVCYCMYSREFTLTVLCFNQHLGF